MLVRSWGPLAALLPFGKEGNGVPPTSLQHLVLFFVEYYKEERPIIHAPVFGVERN